jgi:hypothetical protein
MEQPGDQTSVGDGKTFRDHTLAARKCLNMRPPRPIVLVLHESAAEEFPNRVPKEMPCGFRLWAHLPPRASRCTETRSTSPRRLVQVAVQVYQLARGHVCSPPFTSARYYIQFDPLYPLSKVRSIWLKSCVVFGLEISVIQSGSP